MGQSWRNASLSRIFRRNNSSFLARDLTKLNQKPEGDADEDIEVLKITPEKLNEIISSGEESLDGKTITAWFRACQILNKK